MTLKPCQGCGKEISTWSDACPHCGARPPKKPWNRPNPVAAGILWGTLVVLALYVALTDTGTSTPLQTAPQPTGTATVEENLARIDLQVRSPSADQVQPYRRLLNTLEGRCTEERTLIGDMATRSTQLFEENYSRKVTTRHVLEELEVATRGLGRMDCASVLATLMVMIGQG
jgi:hypothetical protein